MIDGILYKKGYALPYLRCVSLKHGTKLLVEAHEGFREDHSNEVKLAKKITRQGFYRPRIAGQAIEFVKKC